MENILKQLREEFGYTQEKIAEKMNVSVNTVQNWEREKTDNIRIKKEDLHKLITYYRVDQLQRDHIVLQIFGNTCCEKGKNEVYNFPDCLFSDEIIKKAKNVKLSAEEINFYGYLCDHGRKSLDYHFYEKYGNYFYINKIIDSIMERAENLDDMIYDFGKNHIGESFSFCSLSKEQILQIIEEIGYKKWKKHILTAEKGTFILNLYDRCNAIKEPVFLGTSGDLKYIGSFSKPIMSIIKRDGNYKNSGYSGYIIDTFHCSWIQQQCFEIKKIEKTDEQYLKKKQLYISELDTYNALPRLYNDVYGGPPSFTPQYEFWLQLTDIGRQYIEWYESE